MFQSEFLEYCRHVQLLVSFLVTKERFSGIYTDQELGTFGWTTCAVWAQRHLLLIVFTTIGVTTTVAIKKTCR